MKHFFKKFAAGSVAVSGSHSLIYGPIDVKRYSSFDLALRNCSTMALGYDFYGSFFEESNHITMKTLASGTMSTSTVAYHQQAVNNYRYVYVYISATGTVNPSQTELWFSYIEGDK